MPRAKKLSPLSISSAGLIVFLLWQAWSLNHFIRLEHRPPAWDQAVHLEIALDYRNAIRDGRLGDLLYLAPKPGMPPFPPLYHLALIPAYGAQDPVGAALWINWFYLVILCVSIFGIAWDFLKSDRALAAAVLFAGAPAVQWLLHNVLIDLALAACSAAAYWALFRSDGFHKRGASVVFGALFGLGMMHKWSFFSYMFPAYYLAIVEWKDRRCRDNIARAAGIAAILCGPWYWAHLPILPARLTQASSDMATPVWRGLAFFQYLTSMVNDFGLPFWILGWIGILLRHYKGKPRFAWILPASVLASYVFWAIVPNRQMRFLLPGLPALAVLACASFPKPVVWAAALFQLATAANYPSRLVPEMHLPFNWSRIDFFPSNPPRREDWKIAEILSQAQRLHESSSPVSNLTLIANAPYFNPPTFAWAVKYSALPNIRIRGVNKRLCEFSEFVVLKSGTLGPPGVIGGLPEAAKIVSEPGNWFARSYEPAAQWGLPDASSAILYRRRKLKGPPFAQRRYFFRVYHQDPMDARNLKIEFGPWRHADSRYDWIRVSADEVELRQFRVSHVSLVFKDALIVPAGPSPVKQPWDEIRFLKMGEFQIRSLEASAADLGEFIEKRARGVQIDEISMNDSLAIRARFKGFPLRAEAGIELGDRSLDITVKRLGVGPIPIPMFLLRRFRTFQVNLEANPEMPFKISIPPPSLRDGRLVVRAP